jgi:type II secretory pathway component PulK
MENTGVARRCQRGELDTRKRVSADLIENSAFSASIRGMLATSWSLARCRREASALIIVLWVIALLSFLIITALLVAMQNADTTGARKAVFRAKQLAGMGIAVASNPAVAPGDPLFRQRFTDTESFTAVITSEESRLNLNYLLTEDRSSVLERLFVAWGLSEPDAETAVDGLMDWTDEDEFKRLKGAEKQEYQDAGFPDRPFNRPFETLDQAVLAAGMEKLDEVRPDWREWFTLRGSGRLDVNEASAEVLSLTTGAPLPLAETLVRLREGPDGVPHTEDDQKIASVEEAVSLLGIPSSDTAFTELLAVESTTIRIVSIGRAGDLARGIAVVLAKGGVGSSILEWHEFVVE